MSGPAPLHNALGLGWVSGRIRSCFPEWSPRTTQYAEARSRGATDRERTPIVLGALSITRALDGLPVPVFNHKSDRPLSEVALKSARSPQLTLKGHFVQSYWDARMHL